MCSPSATTRPSPSTPKPSAGARISPSFTHNRDSSSIPGFEHGLKGVVSTQPDAPLAPSPGRAAPQPQLWAPSRRDSGPQSRNGSRESPARVADPAKPRQEPSPTIASDRASGEKSRPGTAVAPSDTSLHTADNERRRYPSALPWPTPSRVPPP